MFSLESPLVLDECTLFAACHCDSKDSFDAFEGIYKFISITSGSGKIHLDNKSVDVSENDICIAFPYEKLTFEGSFEFDAACFTINSNRYSESFGYIKVSESSKGAICFRDGNVSATLKGLCNEISSRKNVFSNELVSLFCSQLLVYVLRAFDSEVNDKNSEDVNFKVCSNAMSYIDSHVFTMKNLREVATAMGYNYSYISTLFHKTTGITLNGYFKNKRMNEAKKLLADNKMSISEIARVMNYSSVYAFSKAFKRHFGTSPGHYSGRFIK